MNYRLTLQYDGTDFHGWQIQDSLRTVQGELERTLTQLDGNQVTVYGAGRTDAGVHAEAQVANVYLHREWTSEARLLKAVNGNLPRDVRVTQAQIVDDDFHARFSAIGKTYRYLIFNENFASPFLVRYAAHEARPLDLKRMQQVTKQFLGQHDWTAFSSAQTDARSRVRTVTQLDVAERWSTEARGRVIDVTASADGFLRYMVRSIVGTLLAVGRSELDDDQVAEAIRTGNRLLVGATAHACGLTLVKVHYAITECGFGSAERELKKPKTSISSS